MLQGMTRIVTMIGFCVQSVQRCLFNIVPFPIFIPIIESFCNICINWFRSRSIQWLM